jgi:hypothetical protein
MKRVSTLALFVAFTLQTAHAEDFDFTFSTLATSSYTGGGLTPGTVTGELIGLSSNGTSTPNDVLLSGNPDHIQNGDLFAQGWFFDNPSDTSFTVSNGAITAEDFVLFSPTTNQELILGDPPQGAGDNLLINYIFDRGTGNFAGLDGVTFTPVDVPEPGSFSTLLVGCVIAGCAGRRSFLKKRTKRLL